MHDRIAEKVYRRSDNDVCGDTAVVPFGVPEKGEFGRGKIKNAIVGAARIASQGWVRRVIFILVEEDIGICPRNWRCQGDMVVSVVIPSGAVSALNSTARYDI